MVDIERVGRWINPPQKFSIGSVELVLQTEPGTDFWQRTFYEFRNDNAPAYLWDRSDNFTFSVTVEYEYKMLFDQAGIITWIDENNWIMASVEYENQEFSRLGMLGEKSMAMGVTPSAELAIGVSVGVGIYAVSARDSQCEAKFLQQAFSVSPWEIHD